MLSRCRAWCERRTQWPACWSRSPQENRPLSAEDAAPPRMMVDSTLEAFVRINPSMPRFILLAMPFHDHRRRPSPCSHSPPRRPPPPPQLARLDAVIIADEYALSLAVASRAFGGERGPPRRVCEPNDSPARRERGVSWIDAAVASAVCLTATPRCFLERLRASGARSSLNPSRQCSRRRATATRPRRRSAASSSRPSCPTRHSRASPRGTRSTPRSTARRNRGCSTTPRGCSGRSNARARARATTAQSRPRKAPRARRCLAPRRSISRNAPGAFRSG